ncbi:SRPBCC family protein [Paraburkholderia antibiotica]|uniref:Vanillate O-demethylase oxidoreductase VanB n=1 Tax=Paraburkholderia antibiotica TaxID=2728839 RepID=A0A7Y0A0P7_9BURK|nr:SRPBCC family protein [Paraburkholderia antibiotica]NML34365.1 vanillate O-demethylase oxidoreductase VanB [Paraburkholderia antibiotica]
MNSITHIEKTVTLKAPVSRVWRAMTDAREFGSWFGIELAGEFVEGEAISGSFPHEFDEAAILEFQRKLGLSPTRIRVPAKPLVFCTVERIEPERYFSFRWIPYGIDIEADPDNEPTTRVEFKLEAVADGTLLTIVESGFEHVPVHRRQRAFMMNDAGWSAQAANVKRYVEGA